MLDKSRKRINTNLFRKNCSFFDDYPEELKYIKSLVSTNNGTKRDSSPYVEVCYRILNDLIIPPVCCKDGCENPVKFHLFSTGYSKACCIQHANKFTIEERFCVVCSNTFEGTRSSLYCSDECQKKANFENSLDLPFGKSRGVKNITNRQVLELKSKTECCMICDTKFKNDADKFLDHCHDTGEARGILCKNCNTALGMFFDNKEYLRNSIKYLEKFDESKRH